jgi:hypothetical protein
LIHPGLAAAAADVPAAIRFADACPVVRGLGPSFIIVILASASWDGFRKEQYREFELIRSYW